MSEIIIYEDPDAPNPVQVTLEGDTVWLTQAQMAELFQVKPQNITMHLKKVYADDELQEAATCKDFLQVQTEGTRQVERTRKLYNLDAIISVGYRVNSKRGVRFRQWAASVLKDHLLRGYSLNRHRLAERGVEEARAALDLLARTLTFQSLLQNHPCLNFPSLGRSASTSALVATPTRARVRILLSQGRAMNHMAVAPPTK
jgi:hypothetical protein